MEMASQDLSDLPAPTGDDDAQSRLSIGGGPVDRPQSVAFG